MFIIYAIIVLGVPRCFFTFVLCLLEKRKTKKDKKPPFSPVPITSPGGGLGMGRGLGVGVEAGSPEEGGRGEQGALHCAHNACMPPPGGLALSLLGNRIQKWSSVMGKSCRSQTRPKVSHLVY